MKSWLRAVLEEDPFSELPVDTHRVGSETVWTAYWCPQNRCDAEIPMSSSASSMRIPPARNGSRAW